MTVEVEGVGDDGTAVSPEAVSACTRLRQGHIVDVKTVSVQSANGLVDYACPEGNVIITQTCDLVRSDRPFVLIAPVVQLTGNDQSLALKGKKPRYVPIPSTESPVQFADLSVCTTVSKQWLSKQEIIAAGVDQEVSEEVRKFASRIGRRFSRFPFPDEVQPWFLPLQAKVRDKYSRNSSLGLLLRKSVDIRIESDDWYSPNMELVIHLIVPVGEVPHPDDFLVEDITPGLQEKLRPNGALIPVDQIADMVLRHQETSADKHLLWNAFVEGLAGLCRLSASEDRQTVKEAVSSVTGQLWTEEEFSLAKYRVTESLDLEDLSPATVASPA
ncbi:hypothetical protein ACIQH9_21805 [Pseudarthrobacter oxydans]|uniref:hypothetical protein n=1 Tax=Pseudarthrobacter oxydans TaxID=1671 RepID=UPI0038075406